MAPDQPKLVIGSDDENLSGYIEASRTGAAGQMIEQQVGPPMAAAASHYPKEFALRRQLIRRPRDPAFTDKRVNHRAVLLAGGCKPGAQVHCLGNLAGSG